MFKHSLFSLEISIKACICSILKHNTSILSLFKISDINFIKKVQKRYSKKVWKFLNLKFNNYADRLKSMGLESLEYRRLKFELILLYQIFNNIIYIYFNKYFVRKNFINI